jgi:hypothetical protein
MDLDPFDIPVIAIQGYALSMNWPVCVMPRNASIELLAPCVLVKNRVVLFKIRSVLFNHGIRSGLLTGE